MSNYDKYDFFYKLYEGASTVDNYENLCKLYNIYKKHVNEDVLSLLTSLINDNRFKKSIDIDKFCDYLDILESDNSNRNIVINTIVRNTDDIAQINAINRIIKINKWRNRNITNIRKKCPRCNYITIASNDTDYVICGYNEKKGYYDTKGCGFDWCFKCEKKLCKCWELNNLFDKYNRTHNSKCCKHYAKYVEDVYPDNFCMCRTSYVNRDYA